MRVVITEDIIRNALNESIDEFMINEGAGDTVKKVGKGAWDFAKKAGNFVKNAAAMWMDMRTHGQWNKKYGINPKGNNFAVGTYYMKNWLDKHHDRIYDIVWGDYYNNRNYFYAELNGRDYSFKHDWKTNRYTLTDNRRYIVYNLQINNYSIPSMLTVTDYNGNIKDKSINTKFQNNMYYKINNNTFPCSCDCA